jgi:LytS/YehU family sensor histidine kinase
MQIKSDFHAKNQNHLITIKNNLSKPYIFNTLKNINRFIIDNDAIVSTNYVSKFGKLLRHVLNNSGLETITLSAELAAVELYIVLETMRFKNNKTIKILVQSQIDIEHISVPPLVLQPFLEQAIWHSFLYAPSNNTILIEIQLDGQNNLMYCITEPLLLKITIDENTKPSKEIEKQLNITKKWIQQNTLLFKVESINLYNSLQEPIATKTSITIPLIPTILS